MSHVEYAVSGRAGCKACGQKIAAQDVRVGEEREGDWGTFMAWKHLHCAYRRGVRSAQPSGLSRLSAEDQQRVRDFCAGLGPAAEAPLSLADAVAALSPPRLAAPSPAASQPPHASPLASQPPLLSDAEGESEEERAAREVLFGTLQSDIVGVRYYSGTVHAGEYVSIVREPRNAYDANACRVDNLAGTQVGHIRRQLAAALAPLMDDSSHMRPRLEGSIPRPSSNDFSIPILLSVYGLAEVAPAVAALLARYGARFDPGSGIAAGTAASVVATRTIAAASRTQEELDALLDTLSETDGLTPFDAAVEAPALTTRLHDYQAAGVAWMLRRERDPDGVVSAAGLPPFWQRVQERGATAYLNTITNSSHAMPPPPVYGGLLADDMGLGKSVQVIATILAHPAPGVKCEACRDGAAAAQDDDDADDGLDEKSLKQLQAEAGRRKLPKTGTKAQLIDKIRGSAAAASGAPGAAATAPRGTLVVCPVSVIDSWMEQLAAHTRPGALRSYVYAGAGRNPDPAFLASFDVVIVSYNTLAAEHTGSSDVGAATAGKRKRAEGVHAVEWRRVVLDEAHTIRNRGTRAHAAALALRGTLRWCLSGTPVQNRADDAQPLFAFLRCAPLAEWSVWNRAVGRPVRDGDPAGLARLRLLLRSLSLRRTKALLAHLIPPKTVEVHAVKLDAASREAYDALFRSARSAVAAAAAQGDDALLSLYTPVLECILRLRQAADAAVLVPPARLAAARELLRRAGDASKPALGREEALRLFAALAGALAAPEDNDCCVCLEPLAEAAARVLRACKHTLCDACLGRIAATQPARCPLCRATFTARDVLSKETLASAAETAAPVADEPADAALPLVPPKVAALLEGLSAMAAEGLDRKCVVFSQFTSFIDVMGAHLTAAGWPCARLDGSMPAAARSAALAAWRVPNDRGGPPVLLVSTRAGGVGLNLTSANHCFLMDAWWNAAADEQAMDRVHRLGQTRPVRVIRFVAKDTVEEKMLAMQAAKAALGKGALTKLNADEARTARAADLRSLFEI